MPNTTYYILTDTRSPPKPYRVSDNDGLVATSLASATVFHCKGCAKEAAKQSLQTWKYATVNSVTLQLMGKQASIHSTIHSPIE